MNTEFINRLRQFLKNRGGFKENYTHFVTFCPYCEIDTVNKTHGHLYISKDPKLGHPYDCKKCVIAGRKINTNLLTKLGIRDNYMHQFVNKNFKQDSLHVISMNERDKKLDYKINENVYKNDLPKIDYINNRLDYDFNTSENLKKFKIITSFKRFIKLNDININKSFNDIQRSKIDMIDKNYIGFLSHHGNMIVFRKIIDDEKLLDYENFIINTYINKPFMYTPVTSIQPLAENPSINAAEGIFDILGVYLTFDGGNNDSVYIATGSLGAYKRGILHALNMSGYFGGNLNLWLDNDQLVKSVNMFDYSNIIKMIRVFGNSFKISGIINLNGKDFGNRKGGYKLGKIDLSKLI